MRMDIMEFGACHPRLAVYPVSRPDQPLLGGEGFPESRGEYRRHGGYRPSPVVSQQICPTRLFGESFTASPKVAAGPGRVAIKSSFGMEVKLICKLYSRFPKVRVSRMTSMKTRVIMQLERSRPTLPRVIVTPLKIIYMKSFADTPLP